MIRDHLSESEMQQYASGEIKPDTIAAAHIQQCKNCRIRIINYQLIFSAFKEEPRPVLDFDTAALVMAQLPSAVHSNTESKFFRYAFIFIAAIAVTAPIYFFRNLFINMADSVTSFSLYSIAAAGALIVCFKLFGMYKKYQKQITLINFN